MKENKLTIIINKPAQEVFEFTLDPTNTPKWIDGVAVEEANETPVKVGTIYRNRGDEAAWTEYVLTLYEPFKTFILSKKDSNYHVKYTLTPLGENECEFEYYEWVSYGELEDVFPQVYLEKLKEIMEES